MRFLHTFAIAAVLGWAATGGLQGVHPRVYSAEGGMAAWPNLLRQRLDHEGIAGTLVLAGGGDLHPAAQAAFAAAVPADTTVVIIPAATTTAPELTERVTQWLRAADIHRVTVAGPSFPSDGDAADAQLKLADLLRSAGGVWLCGDQPSQLAERYAGSVIEAELQALLRRGGVVGADAAVAASLAGVMIAPGAEDRSGAKIAAEAGAVATTAGLELLPGAILDQLGEHHRSQRLASAVAERPERFGLGIAAGTTVVIQGRSLQVIGAGAATIVLAEASRQAAIEQPIPAGGLVDLTQLQRAARWRAAAVDPGQPCFGPPHVASGSLVIVGGGGMPQEIVDRFLMLAGGPAARIVVLPTAVPRQEALRARVPRFLARADVAAVTLLPHSRTEEIADEAFATALQEATGIWFDGGRQWNFVDAYENTRAIELFHAVLRRGGVIGGSSAGATIQGEYLVRGHPLGNQVMMAEGYERGFAFLPGVAIDQHFSQRQRQRDLIPVIQRHPQLLGIGIDEGTALVVSGSRAEVIGEHAVHFLRLPSPPPATTAEHDAERSAAEAAASPQPKGDTYLSVTAGEAIDLQTLEPIPASPQTSPLPAPPPGAAP